MRPNDEIKKYAKESPRVLVMGRVSGLGELNQINRSGRGLQGRQAERQRQRRRHLHLHLSPPRLPSLPHLPCLDPAASHPRERGSREPGAMSPSGELLASISSALAVAFVLLACVELGDAAAAVGVYRLIQYDLAGAPLGSRAAVINHHAAALPLPAGADLSRSALVAPLLDLPLSFLRGQPTSLSLPSTTATSS